MRADRIDIDAFAGPRSSRTSRSPGAVAGAPAVGAGTGVTGAAVTGVRAASFPVRLDECTGATLAAGGRCQVLLRLDPFLVGAADATLRLGRRLRRPAARLRDRRLHFRR
jgi:hypothetical protein